MVPLAHAAHAAHALCRPAAARTGASGRPGARQGAALSLPGARGAQDGHAALQLRACRPGRRARAHAHAHACAHAQTHAQTHALPRPTFCAGRVPARWYLGGPSEVAVISPGVPLPPGGGVAAPLPLEVAEHVGATLCAAGGAVDRL